MIATASIYHIDIFIRRAIDCIMKLSAANAVPRGKILRVNEFCLY